jgi:uncharacterized membrane-anchored protein
MAEPATALKKHPQFEAAMRATHSRPALPVKAPAEINHAIVLAGEADQGNDRRRFVDAVEAIGWEVVQESTGEVLAVKDRSTMKWERHTEFISLTAVAGEKLGNTEASQAFESTLEELAVRIISLKRIATSASCRERACWSVSPATIWRSAARIPRCSASWSSATTFRSKPRLLHDSAKMVEYRATLINEDLRR